MEIRAQKNEKGEDKKNLFPPFIGPYFIPSTICNQCCGCGSLSFGQIQIRIRIVKWENGSGTDPGSKNDKNKEKKKNLRKNLIIFKSYIQFKRREKLNKGKHIRENKMQRDHFPRAVSGSR